jgi:hypothetical protein
MKKRLSVIFVLLVAALFLASPFASARKSKKMNRYQRCTRGCEMAQTHLLKACEKFDTPDARKKCRTVGTKKLQEECMSRCKSPKSRKGK